MAPYNSADGSVRIVPPAQRFVTGPWGTEDPEKKALALALVNAIRQRDGLPDLVDT